MEVLASPKSHDHEVASLEASANTASRPTLLEVNPAVVGVQGVPEMATIIHVVSELQGLVVTKHTLYVPGAVYVCT